MEQEIIANIKSLAIDMIDEAESGHPGIVLSAAPILYTLYANHLNVFPDNPDWYNRDRFVLSAGHGSALLYATLFMSGYDIKLDDLKKFRQINSITPGHPEVGVTPGVECSTGPLGQGLATSVGIALGERILNSKYPFYHFNTYVLVGDGDLMEGISYEACSLAGTLNLSNLIILYDSNNMSLDGSTDYTFKENVINRFKSFGFETFTVSDGNNLDELNTAIKLAKKSDKPSFIEVKTKIGYGSLLEGTNKVHGKPLDKEDIQQLKSKLNISNAKFYVNNDAQDEMIENINDRIRILYKISIDECSKYIKEKLDGDSSQIKDLFRFGKYNILDYEFDVNNSKEATRLTNEKILNELSKHISLLIGGSADLNSSTKTYLKDMGDISSNNYCGRNIWFGVRENAMGAILNGLALLKIRTFGSTFLSFSDYLKPSLRMSCLMKLPVTYIFTHDSILVGEDGPTHQPVEQLITLRSIPNLNVYRPSDAKELIGCWQSILNHKHSPSALVLSRTDVNLKENTSSIESLKGGYIVDDCANIDMIIIATGTELDVALQLKKDLAIYGIRIVSMPCKELFLKQSAEYQKKVLPNVLTIVIEASSSYNWFDITKYVIGINEFGVSGKQQDILIKYHYDYDSIKERILRILSNYK